MNYVNNDTDAEFARLVEGLDLDTVTRQHRRRGWAWLAGACLFLLLVVVLLSWNVFASFVAVCLAGVCVSRTLTIMSPLVSASIARLNARIR